MTEHAFAQVHKQAQIQKPIASRVLQRKCDKCRKKRTVLERYVGDPALNTVQRSPVQPLEPAASASEEPRFAYDFSQIPVHPRSQASIQAKLTVNTPGDIYEQEADRVADKVLAVPGRHAVSDAPPRIQRFSGQPSWQTATAPASIDLALASPGRPLEPALRQDMEQRFGHDFSQVQVHSDDAAQQSAREVNANAYTVGHNIVFGAGQFVPETHAGRRLLAHELTHVVQQSQTDQLLAVQRQTFVGGPGKTAKDKDRPLTVFQGPMLPTSSPGGTVVPGTAGTAQNCAGDSCSINKWINWPFLGLEVPGFPLSANLPGDWGRATNFVPAGCTRVNCSGIDTHSTRCKASELELIAFLYRWPVTLMNQMNGKIMAGTQSDFHMIGRNAGGLPRGWHSKMDQREKVVDIRDPWQSLHDSYPHTMMKDRTKVQLCFCCDQSAIKTT